MGPDAHRWVTVRAERDVLAVARTFTSATRVLDAVDVFRADRRVQVVFAVDRTSAFNDGTAQLLRDVGARIVPWPDISANKFDLAVTASENVDLRPIDAPVVVLPHGIGFHKFVPDSETDAVRVSGVVPDARLRAGRVVMAVSHPEQRDQLAAHHPEAARHAVVVGDPTHDRLRACRPLRDHYRRVLGAGDRRLVLLSSSWGRGSLLGRHPDLPARLLAELPADEYRVALVLHPNAWYGHGSWQVRSWLADARDAGLLLVPPHAGWQAALLAADVVVGDHGSVTVYAAAAGRPVLLACFDETELVPGTPLIDFGRRAVRLDPERPPRGQLDAAIAGRHGDPLTAVTARMFAASGRTELGDLLYGLLELPPPAAATHPRAFPDPPVAGDATAVDSYIVYAARDTDGALALWRHPAAVGAPEPPRPDATRHLCAGEHEPDRLLPDNAAVLYRRDPSTEPDALAWAEATLRRYRGARLAAAATERGCVAVPREGRPIMVTTTADPGLAASAIHACVRTGSLANGPLRVRTGHVTQTLSVMLRP